ncbi:hypothetical protein VLL29_20975, partial [Bacillus altitudinis]
RCVQSLCRQARDGFKRIIARVREYSAEQLVVERMARAVADVAAQNRRARQIHIADGVQNFVTHKFIIKTQAVAV